MSLSGEIKQKIDLLKREYDSLKKGKESLLDIIFEAELPESVYNSNAIENSTLTIAETEKILMEMEVSRDVSVREVFEAKNLARVFEYIKNKVVSKNIDKELMLFQLAFDFSSTENPNSNNNVAVESVGRCSASALVISFNDAIARRKDLQLATLYQQIASTTSHLG